MAELRLWGNELEKLRPEARATSDGVLPMFADLLGSPEMPSADRFRHQRAHYDALRRPVDGTAPEASDRVIGGRRCRVFVPQGPPQGLYVQIHGGGWSVGTPEDGDADNLRRCRELGLVIVSPQYRLAPEHPYPTAFEDVLSVIKWLFEHADREWGVGSRMVIGGGSAGAHLAAGTALRIRDELGAIDRVAGLNLVVGIFDLSRTPSQTGVRSTGGGDVLDVPLIQLQVDNFVGRLSLDQLRSPAVSPLYADLRSMPRSLVTAGHDDHLLDDSLFFAQRLAAAGNRVDLRVYPDSNHSFFGLPTKMAAAAHAAVDEFLVSCFAQGTS